MFCRNCGESIPVDSVFCPNCGKNLLEVASASNATRTDESATPTVTADEDDVLIRPSRLRRRRFAQAIMAEEEGPPEVEGEPQVGPEVGPEVDPLAEDLDPESPITANISWDSLASHMTLHGVLWIMGLLFGAVGFIVGLLGKTGDALAWILFGLVLIMSSQAARGQQEVSQKAESADKEMRD